MGLWRLGSSTLGQLLDELGVGMIWKKTRWSLKEECMIWGFAKGELLSKI